MGNSKSYPSPFVPAPLRLSVSSHPPIPFFLTNPQVNPLSCTQMLIHKTQPTKQCLYTHYHSSSTVSPLLSHTVLCVLFQSLTVN